jgi:hypothetical protein
MKYLSFDKKDELPSAVLAEVKKLIKSGEAYTKVRGKLSSQIARVIVVGLREETGLRQSDIVQLAGCAKSYVSGINSAIGVYCEKHADENGKVDFEALLAVVDTGIVKFLDEYKPETTKKGKKNPPADTSKAEKADETLADTSTEPVKIERPTTAADIMLELENFENHLNGVEFSDSELDTLANRLRELAKIVEGAKDSTEQKQAA